MTAPTLDRPVKMTSSHNVSLPKEMLALPHWVVANDQKVPHNPRTGRRADPTNPATWGTYAQAEARRQREGGHLGFVLTREAGIVAIDLDNCRDPETRTIQKWALEIMDAIDSYTEPSVSGTGVHIYAFGVLPAGGRKRGPVEMYDDARYVIVTGQPFPGRDRLAERTAELASQHRATFGDPEPSRPAPITTRVDLADDELLERAFAARNGDKVRRLYEGNLSDYNGDQSAADLAFVSCLTFWTQDDEQVSRILAASGLYRPKWHRPDYQQRTIRKARSRGATYDPAYGQPLPSEPNPQDATLVEREPALPDDPEELKRIVILQRRKIVSLEAQYALLAQRYRATMAALASPNLGPEKVTAIVVADELERQATSVAAKPTADGAYPVPLARIAERTGDSEEAVSRKLKKLERLDLFERQVKYIPRHVDPETGEVTGDRNMTYLRPKVEPTAMYQVVAAAPPSEKGKKNGHGGARVVCPEHPDAGTVKRWTMHCAECDRLLDRGESDPIPADPNPQDAGLVASDAETAPEPAEHPPRGYPLHSDGKSATCYNDDETFHNDQPRRSSRVDAPPGSIAALWQAGQALPGFGALPPAPPDPYTDVGYGRRAP